MYPREDGLYLHQSPSRFHLVPLEQHMNLENHLNESITIDRSTGRIELIKDFINDSPFNNTTTSFVFGVLGIKKLIRNTYLIVITSAKSIARICEEPIYELRKAELIPFKTGLAPDKDLDYWEDVYKSMIENVLKVPGFYFSPTYDLTNTLQRNYINKSKNKTSNSQCDETIGDYFDERFLWNGSLVEDFRKAGESLARFWVPLIHGFISSKRLYIGIDINWTLISRRSSKRAGTRFNSRGIDNEGNVSNFVETEQIVDDYHFEEITLDNPIRSSSNPKPYTQTSFVQVRGSIPLIWSQKANYRYKPAIDINRNLDQIRPMQVHFEELLNFYKDVSVVNLIDSRGHEGELEYEFSKMMEQLNTKYNIPYHYFDFHKECSKMRYHNLAILLGKLEKQMESYGCFTVDHEGQIKSLQNGVIRSNCIDSLDRTNVFQSRIAMEALKQQVRQLNGGERFTKIDDYPPLRDTFNIAWANNADTLSIQYAGTPALKTDFTRTGKRTRIGMIKDGVNSLTRYVTNNFCDDYRQDAIDLFLGNFRGYPSPLYKPLALTTYTSPLPVSIVVFALVALYLYFRFSRGWMS